MSLVTRQTAMIVCSSIAGACVVAACTGESRYRTLRFFFDGVPEPGAPPAPVGYPIDAPAIDTPPSGALVARPRTAKKIWSHAPFRENRCADCHDARTGGTVRTTQEGLCGLCHSVIPGPARYVHGPVAVSDCCACHHYHSSVYPKLLLDESTALCFRCHDRADLTEGRYHAEAREDTCLDCHHPHAGDNPFFLMPVGDWGSYVHGPVAVGDCGFCHGHDSPAPSEGSPSERSELCFRCHDSADLTEGAHHATILEQTCTDCHDPHGGNDPRFLRQAER